MVDKKAISPLIATLLLIAFTVALGVMIMNWGGSIVPDYGTCDSVTLRIPTVPNSICYKQETNTLFFTIENQGKSEIASLHLKSTNIKATDQNRVLDIPVDQSKIAIGGSLVKQQTYLKPELFELQIVPYILVKNQEQACLEKAVKISSLQPCV